MKDKNIPQVEICDSIALENELIWYRKIFHTLVLTWDLSEGITWSLGYAHTPRQIDLSSRKASELTPTEVAIVALSLTQGDLSDPMLNMAHQHFLLELGIVTHQDIILHSNWMIARVRAEHAVRSHYLRNMVECQAQIIMLHRAYEKLQWKRSTAQKLDLEERVLLGMVIAQLGGTFRLRPYMVDPELQWESWVECYDHLFDWFQHASYRLFSQAGYEDQWHLFLSVRDMIAKRKNIPTVEENLQEQLQASESHLLMLRTLWRFRSVR